MLYSGSESSGVIQVVVAVLQGELSDDVAVRIFTEDGTALSTTDYTSVDQILTFSPTNTRIMVSVNIQDDAIDEIDEIFIANLELDLANSVLSALIQPEEATLRILDDDGTAVIHEIIDITLLNVKTCECGLHTKLCSISYREKV